MSRFVLNQTHPLIPRSQNYVLERKIISIHSNDRDISKWPKANHFEIELPEDITNVQSMRLVEITLPNNHYVFTNAYQNTKLSFDISGVGSTRVRRRNRGTVHNYDFRRKLYCRSTCPSKLLQK